MMLHVMQTLLTLTLISVMLFFMSETLKNLERDEVRLLREIRNTLNEIRDLLKPAPPILTQARCITVPKTVNVGDSFNVAIAGLDQFGQPFPLDANYSVTYGASNPAAVQLPSPPQPDGSGGGTALAADPSVLISATITGPGGLSVNATADTLTINAIVVPPALTSASVVIT